MKKEHAACFERRKRALVFASLAGLFLCILQPVFDSLSFYKCVFFIYYLLTYHPEQKSKSYDLNVFKGLSSFSKMCHNMSLKMKHCGATETPQHTNHMHEETQNTKIITQTAISVKILPTRS